MINEITERLCININRATAFYYAFEMVNSHYECEILKVDTSAVIDGFLFITVKADSVHTFFTLGDNYQWYTRNYMLMRHKNPLKNS